MGLCLFSSWDGVSEMVENAWKVSSLFCTQERSPATCARSPAYMQTKTMQEDSAGARSRGCRLVAMWASATLEDDECACLRQDDEVWPSRHAQRDTYSRKQRAPGIIPAVINSHKALGTQQGAPNGSFVQDDRNCGQVGQGLLMTGTDNATVLSCH